MALDLLQAEADVVRFVRRHNPHCRIVVGGPYIYGLYLSRTYGATFRQIDADFFVIGQHGEAARAAR